jgi:hypothetical protein
VRATLDTVLELMTKVHSRTAVGSLRFRHDQAVAS